MKREHIAQGWLENNGPIYAGCERVGRGYRITRESGTDDWQILATTAGHGMFYSSGCDLHIAAGSVVLMPPGVRHDYGPDEASWEYNWVHFQPQKDWVELMQWPKQDGGLMEVKISEEAAWRSIVATMEQVAQYSRGLLQRKQRFMANSLESVLLQCDLWNPLSRHHSIDPRILAAMDDLRDNFAQDVSLTELAARNCMSVSNLSHLFRKHVGIGPMKYLDIQRLEYARSMLENTEEPVNKIAAQAGFELCYFSLHFKKHTMFSPRAYRARFRAVKTTPKEAR